MTDAAEIPGGPTDADGSAMPYTVFFPVDGAYRPADLEHSAPLPRVGDTIEYIDVRGRCSRYVVREVIHTLQLGADRRPVVGSQHDRPAAFAAGDDDAAELPGDGSLRAGVPKVILERSPSADPTEEREGFTVRVEAPTPED
jgi:hypothetical protein